MDLNDKQRIAGAITYLESFESFKIGHSPVLQAWQRVVPTDELDPAYETLFSSHFDDNGNLHESRRHCPAMQATWGDGCDPLCTSITMGDLHALVNTGKKPHGLVLFESVDQEKAMLDMDAYIADINIVQSIQHQRHAA